MNLMRDTGEGADPSTHSAEMGTAGARSANALGGVPGGLEGLPQRLRDAVKKVHATGKWPIDTLSLLNDAASALESNGPSAAEPVTSQILPACMVLVPAELKGAAESLGDTQTTELAETVLTAINVGPGHIAMTAEGGACRLLADAFVEQFADSGAENYLEVRFTGAPGSKFAGQDFITTIQRCSGKTPHQLRAEAEADAELLRWLRPRFLSVDWDWNGNGSAIVFRFPSTATVSADLNATLRSAMAMDPDMTHQNTQPLDALKYLDQLDAEAARPQQAINASFVRSIAKSIRVALESAAPSAAEAVVEGWTEAYAAFQGAFDTPLARRRDDSEYAQDARRRIRAFNEVMKIAAPPAPQPTEAETSAEKAAVEELDCVREALPEEWRTSVPSVAVSTLVAELALLRNATAQANAPVAGFEREALADERVAFEADVRSHREFENEWLRRRDAPDSPFFGEYVAMAVEHRWQGWQARAALHSTGKPQAIPSPAVAPTQPAAEPAVQAPGAAPGASE